MKGRIVWRELLLSDWPLVRVREVQTLGIGAQCQRPSLTLTLRAGGGGGCHHGGSGGTVRGGGRRSQRGESMETMS